MSPTFFIHDWRDYQGYKDRKPKWFRVDKELRRSLTYRAIKNGLVPPTDAEIGQIVGLFCLAAEHDSPSADKDRGPELPCDPGWIKSACGFDTEPDLSRLESLGVIEFNGLYNSVGFCTDPLQNGTNCYVVLGNRDNTEEKGKNEKGKDSILKSELKKDKIPYIEIIDYLNARAGTKFSPSGKSTRRLIAARWADGATIDDFKAVIDDRARAWLSDPKMRQYLRPATLFNQTKWEQYMGQIGQQRATSAPVVRSLADREDAERDEFNRMGREGE